jgi:translation elongation factor EF-Ts
MAGRIESYIHSDDVTENKGGCMVEVSCGTDKTARSEEFKEFVREVAKKGYAVSGATNAYVITFSQIAELFPEVFKMKVKLEKNLKESITVLDAVILKLDSRHSRSVQMDQVGQRNSQKFLNF